jgi:hypothetical protein
MFDSESVACPADEMLVKFQNAYRLLFVRNQSGLPFVARTASLLKCTQAAHSLLLH